MVDWHTDILIDIWEEPLFEYRAHLTSYSEEHRDIEYSRYSEPKHWNDLSGFKGVAYRSSSEESIKKTEHLVGQEAFVLLGDWLVVNKAKKEPPSAERVHREERPH